MRNYRPAQRTNTRLTEADVRSMRLRHAQGKASTRELSLEYGLATESVRKILRRETWAMVSEEGPGAPAEAWVRPPPSDEEIAASLKRFQALIAPTSEKLMPSLDEVLRKEAEEAAPSPVLGKLKAELAVHARLNKELDELAGHGDGAGVRIGTSTILLKPTDGGTK